MWILQRPYCWSCGSSSGNVNSVSCCERARAIITVPLLCHAVWTVHQPHFSDWLTPVGCRVVQCRVCRHIIGTVWALWLLVVYNVWVQKLLHPVWVRLKVKGFKDRFVPPVQTFWCLRWTMTVVLSWSGFFCDSTNKMMNKWAAKTFELCSDNTDFTASLKEEDVFPVK